MFSFEVRRRAVAERGTHHIVGSDEVLEGEGGSESRVRRQGAGVDDVEQAERVLGFGSLLLEGGLGCKTFVY